MLEDLYWYYNPEDIIVYEANVLFYFYDGGFIRHRIDIAPYYDEYGYLYADMWISGTEASIPFDAVLLDSASTELVLGTFAGDYGNPADDHVRAPAGSERGCCIRA